MSGGELLVILIVMLIVIRPEKLPLAAHHLGYIWKHLHHLKAKAVLFWQNQLNEYQLEENQKKAQQGDKLYAKNNTRDTD